MKVGRTRRIAAALAGVTMIACGGTETGNPPFAPDVGGGGYDPMGISPDPVVDAALIAIEEATLVDCEGARAPLFAGARLDLIAGELVALRWLEVPAGVYCGLELVIDTCDDPDVCRGVAPDAIAIDATRVADGASVVVRDAARVVVALEGTFDVAPEAGGLLVAVDRTMLTSSLGLAALPADDGVVRVDTTSHPDRLPALRAALRGATTLRRDLDGDGRLGPEELAAPPLAE